MYVAMVYVPRVQRCDVSGIDRVFLLCPIQYPNSVRQLYAVSPDRHPIYKDFLSPWNVITSVFSLITFTRRKRGLPSRCAFVFSHKVALLTEDEDERLFDRSKVLGAREYTTNYSIESTPCFRKKHPLILLAIS